MIVKFLSKGSSEWIAEDTGSSTVFAKPIDGYLHQFLFIREMSKPFAWNCNISFEDTT